jgi:Cdc6-like AAA superfamily ATPase
MILPDKKVPASRVNPKKIILYGNPKTGKTLALSELEDCLIIDVESGSDFVDAMKIDVLNLAREENKKPIIILKNIINSIAKANKEKGSYVYKYIAIDTVSALESVVLPLANKLYTNTAQGKSWTGDDVTLLGNGAGYRWTRIALKMIIAELEEVCDTLIILGHVKDKLVGKAGEEMTERGISLTGQMPVILASMADAVGYMYREDNRTVVSFIATESMICGGRCPHLLNKEVDLIVSDDEGNIKVDWSEIFVD